MLLALGLNIVVGYAGLLDLGYVAFYGFGAYAYAMLSSSKFGLHWDSLLVIPVAVVATAILGFLVALPSRRLIGDYLAIVTLFFGQFFVTVVQNGNRISVLGLTRGYDVTGGPNGIPDVDNYDLGGLRISSVRGYYYTALIIFLLVLFAVYLVDQSRTGRAWKSLREDPLAAELMGMPVNWLKLIAFAFGAAIAGLAGTIFAALNTNVFAANFDVPTLIIIYAFVALVFVVLGLTMLRGWKLYLALIPTLYLTAFVWDTRLVVEPSVTRLILIGVILIVLMNARSQGLLGTSRVEIV